MTATRTLDGETKEMLIAWRFATAHALGKKFEEVTREEYRRFRAAFQYVVAERVRIDGSAGFGLVRRPDGTVWWESHQQLEAGESKKFEVCEICGGPSQLNIVTGKGNRFKPIVHVCTKTCAERWAELNKEKTP